MSRVRITGGEYAGSTGTIVRRSDYGYGWIVRLDGRPYEFYIPSEYCEHIA